MASNILYVLFCVFICIVSVLCQLEEGSPCIGEKDGVKGYCAHVHHCLAIVNDRRLKKEQQICSFKGREPIVCCTDCELVNDTRSVLVADDGWLYFKTGQKATDKCLEYMVNSHSLYSCTIERAIARYYNTNKRCYGYSRNGLGVAVGGYGAVKGEYPHMALLGYGPDLQSAQWLCGGSVISDRFILTAAHCISSEPVGPVKYVALGILKRTDPADQWQVYNIKRIIPHPQYAAPSKYHDIALLELEEKIKFSKLVLPACLNAENSSAFKTARATGWGALGHHKSLADTLQVVELKQFTAEECAATYPSYRHLKRGYDHSTQTCYGDKKEIIDTCQGDSGGPLQVTTIYGPCTYQIIGVTSSGKDCGFLGNAGIYTRVEYYVPWIESIVWP